MTERSGTLVFDNSPLSHFARAHRLDALRTLTEDFERLTTRAVMEELQDGRAEHSELQEVIQASWLTQVPVDGREELIAVAEYMRRLGSGRRDMGEATVLAWVEVHGGIAVLDERVGTEHGRERGVEVHGTLWLIARGVRAGILTEEDATDLVQSLADTEAHFPCSGETFIQWARDEGLL